MGWLVYFSASPSLGVLGELKMAEISHRGKKRQIISVVSLLTKKTTNLYSESAEADVIGVVDKTSGDGIFLAETGFELGMS